MYQQAFNFAFKGYFQSIYGRSKEKDGYLRWFIGNVASGSAAGATTSLFLYHLDFVRTRLGTDAIECQANIQRQYKGLFDVYQKTLSTDGVAGLYRGFGVSITGITLYRGLYFGIYDTMKPIVLVGPLQVSIELIFFMWSNQWSPNYTIQALQILVFNLELKKSLGPFVFNFLLCLYSCAWENKSVSILIFKTLYMH